MLDADAIPGWLLWCCALAAMALFLAVTLRIIPPTRKAVWARSMLVLPLVFIAPAVTRSSGHVLLLLGAAIFLGASLPLFWYGPMPADMPLANEPGVRNHPRYREFARRGRIAGCLIGGWVVVVIVLGALFVRVD